MQDMIKSRPCRGRKIGIIGCGTIGRALLEAIEDRFDDRIDLVGVSDLKKDIECKYRFFPIEGLVSQSEIIIECASSEISAYIASLCLRKDKDVLVMSVGGLLQMPELYELVGSSAGRLYLPSGAIAGIDALKAAKQGHIDEVRLTTYKPIEGLRKAIIQQGIEIESIDKELVLFEGNVLEAVKAFPQNINVAATIAFAGIGPERTKVRIVTGPHLSSNSHHIEVSGDFGRIITITDNIPSPHNPRTSYLAILSAIATLRDIIERFQIGT